MNLKEKQFTQMVNENKATIYTVCYMFSNDADEVSDLFQETLINLWRGFDNFEHRSSTRTWVYRIALNTCISIDRKKRAKPTIQLDLDFNVFEEPEQHDNDMRQIDMLHQRITRLQPLDRAIVLLWLENMPYDEIALITGISTKNVSVRLFRIKEQLKKMSNNQNHKQP